MVLSVLTISPTAATRAGFITSRRVGSAVQRNRVRRRLRELVRAARPSLREGMWFVLIARAAAAAAEWSALREEWLALAERAGMFSEKA